MPNFCVFAENGTSNLAFLNCQNLTFSSNNIHDPYRVVAFAERAASTAGLYDTRMVMMETAINV